MLTAKAKEHFTLLSLPGLGGSKSNLFNEMVASQYNKNRRLFSKKVSPVDVGYILAELPSLSPRGIDPSEVKLIAKALYKTVTWVQSFYGDIY